MLKQHKLIGRVYSVVVYTILILSICFSSTPIAHAKGDLKQALLLERSLANSKASLFAKTGSGEYYTLFPEGLEKEDANIGGFKSVQLDPKEENLYFFDSGSKVISRINIKEGKVYKVIGKPKNTKRLTYETPVNFSEASLVDFTDFTLDKYGNIFILDSNKSPVWDSQPRPRILKASLKEGTVKEVFRPSEAFKPASGSYQPHQVNQFFSFNITGLNYDNERYIYVFGTFSYARPGYAITHNDGGIQTKPLIFKFDTLTNNAEWTNGGDDFGFPSKIQAPRDSYTNYGQISIHGLSFDHENTIFLHQSSVYQSTYYFTDKLISSTDTSGQSILKPERLIGNADAVAGDIGDGGSAKDASAGIVSSRSICNDKNGDIYLADSGNSRVRQIITGSGLVTTAVGSGKELLSFGEEKSPRAISLSNPYSLCTDKSNNLYIAEANRIIVVKNLVEHSTTPVEDTKYAKLAIVKIAGNEIKDPKGEVAPTDATLSYTDAGDQIVEVKANNIPDGTEVKILTVGENIDNSKAPSGVLKNNLAAIPVKIDSGTTKIIKAETAPFIPAPGVILSSNVQQDGITNSIQLPTEPQNQTPKRDEVNTKNLLSFVSRFNFAEIIGDWTPYEAYEIMIKPNVTGDPDTIGSDATLLDFGSRPNTLYNNVKNGVGRVVFSVWMRTDSGNITVPISIGQSCPDFKQSWNFWVANWVGCTYPQLVAQGQTPSLFSTSYATVTPVWQKFTVTSPSTLDIYTKMLFIGGLGRTYNQKVYLWGAKVEKAQ